MPDHPATSLAGSRVLVTGASGLIGRHVLGALGPDVDTVALSRSPRADAHGVRWVVADLEQPGEMTGAVEAERPDVVIHLAGAVRGDRTLEAVGPTLRANLVASVELLEAATRLGCRRVVLSGSLLEEPLDSGPQTVPPSPYGAARWASSGYGRMFHALFETPVVILRPSYVYGPGQEQSKLIPYLITTLMAGESPRLSTGARLLDWVFVEDVAQAYVRAAVAPDVNGLTLDIGTGVEVAVSQVVDQIVAAIGPSAAEPIIGAVPVRPLEQRVVPDVDATDRALGWRATTPLDEGVRRTVAWYRGTA